jgi:hypothetical protein
VQVGTELVNPVTYIPSVAFPAILNAKVVDESRSDAAYDMISHILRPWVCLNTCSVSPLLTLQKQNCVKLHKSSRLYGRINPRYAGLQQYFAHCSLVLPDLHMLHKSNPTNMLVLLESAGVQKRASNVPEPSSLVSSGLSLLYLCRHGQLCQQHVMRPPNSPCTRVQEQLLRHG